MVGLILAGGEGTRFSGAGCCKPLITVNGKYLITYSLENLVSLGVDRICIVAGRFARTLQAALGDDYCGVPVEYVLQKKPRGILNAVYTALEAVSGETVVLQLSDEIFIGLRPNAVARIADADFLCGYTVPEDPASILGNYALLCDGETVLSTVEKPETAPNEKKGTGFCVFRPACMELLRTRFLPDSPGDLCDFMNALIANGKRGLAVEIAAEEINVNDPESLSYAVRRLEEARDE